MKIAKDFDVKDVVGPIVDELDHTVVVWKEDIELIESLKKLNSTYVVVDFETTAENLCGYFLEKIHQSDLPSTIAKIKVRVCETENTYAEDEIEL